jgi:hypothetical protein
MLTVTFFNKVRIVTLAQDDKSTQLRQLPLIPLFRNGNIHVKNSNVGLEICI